MSYIRLFQKTPPDFEIFGIFAFFAPFWCVFAFGGRKNVVFEKLRMDAQAGR